MSSSFSRKNISNNSLIASFKESSFAFESKLQRKIPERIFPNSVNSFNTKSDGLSDNSFSNNKENKTIFIELKNKRNFEISFKKTEENTLTVSWLLKETLSKIDELSNEDEFSSEHSEKIAFLTSKDKNFNLDFWLTHLDRSVDVIKDGQILIPFYTDCQYEFNENTENIDINYFHLQKIIGMGGFSDVLLVRRKDNGLFYAIKVIEKELITKKKREKIIFNERNVWKELDHKFIAKLYCTFQDNEKLYFVSEYCPGGELFFHLQKQKKIAEEESKILVYEILLAIEYLHSKNIIYRDLKPENVLIDIDGHIKLTDFGLSKKLDSKKRLTYSFCGSEEYLAPEMISKSGHSLPLDFYCLGIFIYELTAGFPPTLGHKKSAIFSDIFKTNIKFPNHFSLQLKSLITRLLEKNPEKRLGSTEGVQEILHHEWFFPLNVEKLKRIYKTSIKPNVYSFYVEKEIQQKQVFINQIFNKEKETNAHKPMEEKTKGFSFISNEFYTKNKNSIYGKSFCKSPISSSTKPIDILKGDTFDWVETPSSDYL